MSEQTKANIRVLAIDPGETSAFIVGIVGQVARPGHSLLSPEGQGHLDLIQWGQWHGMDELLTVQGSLFRPDVHIVCEQYRVYAHKAQQHVGSPVYTAREIGRIEWLAFMNGRPVTFQHASEAKQRWPDKRLRDHFPEHYKDWRQSAHIKDACRHLLTFVEKNEWVLFFRKENAL